MHKSRKANSGNLNADLPVAKYIKAVYGSNSPEQVLHQDFNELKRYCAETYLSKMPESERQSVINCTYVDFVGELISYLKANESETWIAYVSIRSYYYECVHLLVKPIIDAELDEEKMLRAITTKDKLKTSLTQTLEDMKSLREKLFKGDSEIIKERAPEDFFGS
jgi:hypothetical protein